MTVNFLVFLFLSLSSITYIIIERVWICAMLESNNNMATEHSLLLLLHHVLL